MNNESIAERLLKEAREKAERLLKEAREKAEKSMKIKLARFEKQLNAETEDLARMLAEIEDNVIYFIDDNRSYQLVTKEKLLADYSIEKRYGKKIIFNDNPKSPYGYDYYVDVCGTSYYHVAKLIDKFVQDAKEALNNSQERDKLIEKQNLLKRIEKQQKSVIKMYTDYENKLKEKKENDYE